MGSAGLTARETVDSGRTVPIEANASEAKQNVSVRLGRVRKRLLLQIAVGAGCDAFLWLALRRLFAIAFIPVQWQAAELILLIEVVPLLLVEWWNWRGARKTIALMWAFGQHEFGHISRMLAARDVITADVKDSWPYIEVLQRQIVDSLAESEREVLAAIEQMQSLIERGNRLREQPCPFGGKRQEPDRGHREPGEQEQGTDCRDPRCNWTCSYWKRERTSSGSGTCPAMCAHSLHLSK